MTSAREEILNKLRAARRPFEDAPARPAPYQAVTVVEDTTPQGLLTRFTAELERLTGQVHVVEGDAAARAKIVELIRAHATDHILAWDFQYLPVDGLQDALTEANVRVTIPDLIHAPDRTAHANLIKGAGVGLISADAAAASTGTLIVSTAAGRGRMATVLPPVLIAIITPDHLTANLESWLADERANGMQTINNASNLCFITGPSRTGDIEMELVLGVHGAGIVHVVVKQ